MRLHLPVSLFRAVLACMAAGSFVTFTSASSACYAAAEEKEENDLLMLLSEQEYPNGSIVYTTRQTYTLTLTGYEKILFTNIYANTGGIAIHNESSNFSLCGNGDVIFRGSRGSSYLYQGGGAIANANDFSLNDNRSVTFSENNITSHGGAIYNSSFFNLNRNGAVTFSKNTASAQASSSGGAIFNAQYGAFYLQGNENVIFSGNTAHMFRGGAVYNEGGFFLRDNGSVVFTGNSVIFLEDASSYSYYYEHTPQGGAIYSSNKLSLNGNGNILFEKNVEAKGGNYRLRSIYSTGSLNFSPAADKSIIFRDSIYAAGTVTLNQDYTDSEGVVHKSTGDIILTGATTEDDLREVKGGVDGTATEITNSRTSEIATMTNLYGGRLIVEDKAILKGQGITAAADSGATVRVKDGALDHSGYALTFNTGTTLEAEGVNSVSASSVDMLDGSTLSFVVGEANLTTAALTLTGTLTTETISVAIGGLDDLPYGQHYTYALVKASTYNTSAWTADKITIATEGVSFEDLVWDNGTLYLNYTTPPVLSTATWTNASGDGLWNAASLNWTQDGYSYAYADGVDVIIGNEGAGTVSLEGNLAPKSVLVDNGSGFDYTFAGDGKLTGTTTLTKQGEGKLTFNTANDYTGGTAINGGTLVVGNVAALGTSTVTLNSGTLEIAANDFANDIIFAGDSSLLVDEGFTLVLSKRIANEAYKLALNGEIEFKNISSSTYGGAIYNGYEAAFSLSGNGAVTFCGNSSTQAIGGAIFNDFGTFVLSRNEEVTFSGNAAAHGGAIFNEWGSFRLIGNGNVTFSENRAYHSGTPIGGAIVNNANTFTLSDNGNVIFSNNTVSISAPYESHGGAIYNAEIFTMSGNVHVTFSENTLPSNSDSFGGAIANYGTFSLRGNGDVTFSCNSAANTGGAIDNVSTFLLVENGDVTFCGNTASSFGDGGAIGNDGTFSLSGNGDVLFSRNSSVGFGGAIINKGTFSLCGNSDVTFCGNSGTYTGGAIDNLETFTMSGNGNVLFEKNAGIWGDDYLLRSIHSLGTLNLSATAGKSILFRDSVFAEGIINLNQEGSGDIILTGATTEDDLREVKGGVDGTEMEILNSRTSEIATMTNLYGGRLIVEDKAILKGRGITTAADSGATVRVKDGTLNHSGYALTFNNNTKLEAEGASSITASSVAMKAGSTLSFVVGEANLTTAALTLTGTLTTETISVAICGLDELEAGRYTYALMKASTYNTSAWTADKISVVTDGIRFDDMVWDNGTLYLNYAVAPALTTATWSNGSGDGLWNAASLNWTQDGYSYAYADGVDVIFGNEGAGEVSLVGNLAPKSVLVDNGSGFDYTFAGEGKLTGTTALTKQGEGKLSINTANDYTGGTTINGGTLVVGNAAALGTGTVTLKGGTLEIAANDFANNINFAGDSALMVDEGYELLLNTRIANSSYNLTLGGSITFKDISSTTSGGAIYNRGTFELSGNGDVTFSGNTASSYGGAIFNYSNGTFTLSDNEIVTFSGNTASSSFSDYGGAIYNDGTFELSGNGDVTFCDNASSYGGAIYNHGTFELSGNGDATFSGNTASSFYGGGAIENCSNATFTLSGNRAVTFSGNTASSHGGAIYNHSNGTFELSGNGDVTFCDNASSSYSGGAIYNSGTFELSRNGDVTFSGNTASSYGGAIDNIGTFTLSDNEAVTFSGNTTPYNGGAIYNYINGTFTLSGNGDVTFSENTSSSFGGAIYNYSNGTFELSGNGDVTFSGNTCRYGGAIYNEGIFTLSGNGDVTFSENTSSSSGGAIYNTGTFTLSGNENVLFEKNAESVNGVYRLRSIYSSSTLNLASSEGKSITFRDSIYASGTLKLNQDYTDSEGVVHKSTGDIIFTGATTEADLREVKGGVDGTASEITNSRTSEIATMTNLYGGRLIVEDKAILKGRGITAAVDSGATVRVKDGTLNHSGYTLTFNNSTKLEAEGVNAVTAASVDMLAGSTLSFVVGEANLTTAALTLTGTLTTETISLAISGIDVSEQGRYTYALMKASSYDTSAWTADKITVVTEGVSFDDLVWDNGTLYLNYANLPALTTATWSNGSGDGKWNATSLNWTQGDYSYAYADGVDVIFGNEGAGTVSLVGELAPKSVLINNGSGFDYTFAGDGKLTGAIALTKQGEGKLTINTANDYTGGTSINGGTLEVGNAAALGSGTVTLNSGTLEIAASGFANDIAFAGDSTLLVDEGYELVLNRGITNSKYNLSLGGTITFKDIVSHLSVIYNVGGRFVLFGEGRVTFEDNESSDTGGAVFNRGATFNLEGNKNIIFLNNKSIATVTSTVALGGAINNYNHSSFTLNNNGDVTFSGNVALSSIDYSSDTRAAGGAIHNDFGAMCTLSGNGDVLFLENSVSSRTVGSSHVAFSYGGAICNDSEAAFILTNNGNVTFSMNDATGAETPLVSEAYICSACGIAVYNAGTFMLNSNGGVTFLKNVASSPNRTKFSSAGGAIYNTGGFALNDNEFAAFNWNQVSSSSYDSAAIGGAIYNSSTFSLLADGDVTFSGNETISDTASSYGGAIYNSGGFTLKDNAVVTFNENIARTSRYNATASAGAIYNSGSFTLNKNQEVKFSGNWAKASSSSANYYSFGGAIYNDGCFTLSDNGHISFSGNSVSGAKFMTYLQGAASSGGAIYNSGNGRSFILSGNGNVTFSGNSSISENITTYARGGAIYNGSGASISLNGNSNIVFRGNFVSAASDSKFARGGAIYNTSSASFELYGNEDVLFEKNTEIFNGSYRLRSIWSDSTLSLSSSANHSITFRDSIYASGEFNLNGNGCGDIIFTGASTEADLIEVKGGVAGTASEITNSRTSGIATMTNLYGGRLIVEDKAILSGQGITAAADSGATVRVKDGKLNHSGYALTFNTSTKLEAEGASSITASTVAMKAGSTLSFVVGEANLTTEALTLTGTLTTETISVAISGLEDLDPGRYTYALMKASSYNTSAWTADKITVVTDGVSFEDLVWDNGTLYLNYANLPALTTATWDNGSGDGLWNASSINWTQDGYSYAYADGVDVVFGNEGAGTVSLVGNLAPKSVLVDNGSGFDYTFAGDGKLTGSTSLTKQGEGKLTINTANDYSGGTTINGGTLVAGNAAALGTGIVAVNGGTLEIATDGYGNETTFAGTSSLVVDAGYQLALSKMLANSGVLTVSGTLNASSLTLNTIAATHIDVNGNSGTSGFAKGAIYSVQIVNGGTTSGADAAITHLNLPTGETLVLGENGVATAGGSIDYSEYLLTGSATATTSAIHAMGASATVTQNGGTLTVDDAVTVTTTGGTIALNGGTLNGTVSGATINATSGTIGATLSGSNTLNGTNYALQSVIANSGVLTVSGTINAAALTLDTTAATHIDVNGNSGTSGFAKDAIYAVTIANGTTVNSGATITHGEHALTLGTDGVAKTGGAIDYSEYLLTGSATATTSAIHAKGASAMVTQNGGTLTVDDAATVTTTAGTIALSGGTLNGTISGATINAASGALNATLSGNNMLTGNHYELQSVLQNTGNLVLNGSFDLSRLTMTTSGESYVDVSGKEGQSGFTKAGSYSVSVVEGGGQLTLSHVTLERGGLNWMMRTDGTAVSGGGVDHAVYFLTGDSVVSSTAIHGVEGASAAKVSQNGGTLTVDDAATVMSTGGTIILNSGALSGTISGATINASSGALEAALNGVNTLNGTNYMLNGVLDNRGTLTLHGSFNASKLTLDTTDATHINVAGESGANGFAKSAVYAVTIANGTIVNGGTTITHGERTLALGNDGVAQTGGAVDYSSYLLADDAVSVRDIRGMAGAANASITQTGGTLTVDGNATVNATAGTLALTSGTLSGSISGATINATSGTLAATLKGENTLTGKDYVLSNVLKNTGTLTLTGTIDISALGTTATEAVLVDVDGMAGGVSGFFRSAGYTVRVVNGGTTLADGATVTHGGQVLTMGADGVATCVGGMNYGTYRLAGNDAVSVSAVHGVEGAANATITQTGGTLTVDGNATVNATAGTLALTSGTLSGSISGATINATSGTLAAMLKGKNTLTGNHYALNKVLVNEGTLTVGGSISTDALTLKKSNATHINVSSASGANGFAKTDYYEVQLVNGGSVVNSNAVITHSKLPTDLLLALGTNGIANAGGVVDYSNYLLVNGSATVSAIHGVKGAANAAVTQTGGSLTVNGNVSVTTTGGAISLTNGTVSGSIRGASINATGGRVNADISGASSVTVNGKVTLAGANTYTGMTTVNGGSLTSTALAGDISLKGGTLAVESQVLANGQKLAFNGGDFAGSLATGKGSITLSADAGIDGALTLNGGSITFNGHCLAVSGTLTLERATTLNVGSLTEGLYTLMNVDTVIGSTELLSIAGTNLRHFLSLDGGALVLHVLNEGVQDIEFPSDGEGTSWGEGSFGYQDGDDVTFDGTGEITLDGELAPGNITVTGDGDSSFIGSGSITGNAGLEKDGEGTLTMNDGNSYTGTTSINGGTVIAGGDTSFGSGDIALNGGTLNLDGHGVSNDLTVENGTLNGAANYGGELTVNGVLTLGGETTAKDIVLNGGSITGGSIVDTAITANGGTIGSAITGSSAVTSTDDVTLSGNNSYTGGTTVNGGTLTAGSETAFGTGDIALNNGTLDLNGHGVNNDVTVENGTLNGAGNYGGELTVNGSLTLGGETTAKDIVLNGGSITGGSIADTSIVANGGSISSAITGSGSVTSTDDVTLSGNNSYTGGTTVNGGTLTAGSETAFGTGDIALNNGTLDINGHGVNNDVTVENGTLNGAGNYGGELTVNGSLTLGGETTAKDIVLNGGSITGGSIVDTAITANGGTIGSAITGSSAVTSTDDVTLSGNNSYTGGTTVNGGTLTAGSDTAFGTGNIALNNGTLDLNGHGVNNDVTVENGTLNGAGNYGGELTVNGSLTLGGETTAKDIVLNGGSITGGSIADTSIVANGGSISSAITGSSAVTSTDDVTLSGNNSYTGGTTVNGGTLTAGSDTAFGTGDIALNNGTLDLNGHGVSNDVTVENGTLNGAGNYGGELTVNGSLTLGCETTAKDIVLNGGSITGGSIADTSIVANGGSIGSAITGSGSVTSTGDVTLSGNNSYTGGTTVNGGTLTAGSDTAFGTGNISLNNGALDLNGHGVANDMSLKGGVMVTGGEFTLSEGQTLGFNGGSVQGNVTTSAGAKIALESNGTIAGSLTLNGGTLALNGHSLTVTETLTLSGETTLDVSSYGVGTYELLTFGRLEGRLDKLVPGGSDYRYFLTQQEGALTLQVKALNNSLTWSATKGEWKTNAAFGDEVFRSGDDVAFRTAATVTISGEVNPDAVLVDSAAKITFKNNKKVIGSGIAGDAALLKTGTGLLTLNAGNTYSGGTELRAGTLKGTATDSFGSGTIIVKGGTLDLGSKAVANGIVLAGSATLKGDSKFTGAVSVNGKATLLAKTSYKGMTTIGADSLLTLAPKATMAGSITIDGGELDITAPKGMTLAKDAWMLFSSGTVKGLLTIGAKSELVWQDGIFETSAPVLKGGIIDFGGWSSLMLTGSKAQVQFGDKVIELPGKGTVRTDDELNVNSGTVTVNSMGGYEGKIVVNSGTLKLSTGKLTTENDIVVNGTAAVVNGGTHYGNITVDGLLAKGTNITIAADKTVQLNGTGVMLGTIAGAGTVDVNASIDATAAKITAAHINLNSGTFTNTKGIKLAKGQTLTLTGAALDLGPKGALATAAGSTLVVSSATSLTGNLTLGGGELVFAGGTLDVDGMLTLSKAMTVKGSGSITYTTLKPFKGDISVLFGGAEVVQEGNTLTITGEEAVGYRLAPAPLDMTPALPPAPVTNPVADAMVQADWGILDAERAFMGAVNSRHQHAALLDKGQGAAWVSAFGASVRHGSQGVHHGSDGNIEGAAFGLEHAVSESGSIGLAVGRSKNRLAATGVTHLRQETAHVALYGQKHLAHGFTADAAATYGDTETKLGSASWSQKSAALSARLTHAQQLTDATAFRTFGGLAYEATDAGSIGSAHTGSVQNLRAELGAGITHTAGKAHLYAEAALTGDMVRHNPTADLDGTRTHGANPGRLGIRATVGGLYEFTDTWSGTASYGIEAESRSTAHTLNIGVSKSF